VPQMNFLTIRGVPALRISVRRLSRAARISVEIFSGTELSAHVYTLSPLWRGSDWHTALARVRLARWHPNTVRGAGALSRSSPFRRPRAKTRGACRLLACTCYNE
jgi:hypothetical protein